MKEKVSVTVDELLMREVDSLIDNELVFTRSQAMEKLLRSALQEKKVSQALILAGGKGTRLQPITFEIPKPLVLVGGKPMLEHTINHLKKHGIGNIILSLGYKAEKIIQYFGDGSNFGVKIDYVIEKEDEPLGTAGPIRLAKNKLDNNFLVLNGDVICNVDFRELILAFSKNRKTGTILLNEVADASRFGVAELQGNVISRFIEKPKPGDTSSRLINAGRYVFNKKIISLIGEGAVSLEKEVFPKLIENTELAGYACTGASLYWSDLGTIEALNKFQDDLNKGRLEWLF